MATILASIGFQFSYFDFSSFCLEPNDIRCHNVVMKDPLGSGYVGSLCHVWFLYHFFDEKGSGMSHCFGQLAMVVTLNNMEKPNGKTLCILILLNLYGF